MNYTFNFKKYKIKIENLEKPKDDEKEEIVDVKRILYEKFSSSFKIHLHLSYLLIKLIYLINTIVQLILINYFLTNSVYKFDAIGILKQMINGENNQETSVFPIVVQCDLRIAHEISDESHFYSIRCILSLNMFVEKIYVFLWIWCLIVATMTFFDLISWSAKFIFMKQNYRFVKNRLASIKINGRSDKYLLKLFVYEYLSRDGVFILRLIEDNAGILVTNDLILKLWNDFTSLFEDSLRKSFV